MARMQMEGDGSWASITNRTGTPRNPYGTKRHHRRNSSLGSVGSMGSIGELEIMARMQEEAGFLESDTARSSGSGGTSCSTSPSISPVISPSFGRGAGVFRRGGIGTGGAAAPGFTPRFAPNANRRGFSSNANDQTDTYANLDSDGSTDISDDFAQYMTDAAAKEEAEREDAERALAQKMAADADALKREMNKHHFGEISDSSIGHEQKYAVRLDQNNQRSFGTLDHGAVPHHRQTLTPSTPLTPPHHRVQLTPNTPRSPSTNRSVSPRLSPTSSIHGAKKSSSPLVRWATHNRSASASASSSASTSPVFSKHPFSREIMGRKYARDGTPSPTSNHTTARDTNDSLNDRSSDSKASNVTVQNKADNPRSGGPTNLEITYEDRESELSSSLASSDISSDADQNGGNLIQAVMMSLEDTVDNQIVTKVVDNNKSKESENSDEH